MAFSEVPFFKDHLKQQIEAAGGTVYNNFENVPTNKYRNCFLLAPFPCITAKYVQCLAANIPVSFFFVFWTFSSIFGKLQNNTISFFIPNKRRFHMNGLLNVVNEINWLAKMITYSHLDGQL